MGISTAVPSGDVSRTSGYQLNKGNFSTVQPYLPQQLVILGEANTANQGTIVTTPVQITTAAQAGATYGYGSPIHAAARILFPNSGNGIGGIPVIVMAQLAAGGSTATVIVISISGVATKSKTHYLNIAGRETLDGSDYSANIVIGDFADAITTKYFNAVNAVLSSPVIATKSTTAGTATASTVVFNASSLTAGQTMTLAGLTYTSTGSTTQAQLATAFASLANGATTGGGTGTGTYSGVLTGFSTGAATSSTTVVFTSTTVGINAAVSQSGTGAVPTITTVPGTLPTGSLTLTSKWTGLSSAALTAIPDVAGDAVGLTYAIASNTPGTGTPSIAGALAQFESAWYTLLLNTYGTTQLTALETFNGIPDNQNPTGLYSPLSFRPFMAFFGSTDPVAADLVAITDASARIPNVTNVLCPAPNSGGMPYEAATNMLLLFANVAQSAPHSTAAGQSYTDMPVPATNLIGDLSVYANRNLLKTKGCSTVTLKNGAYKVQDLVNTYHPAGEIPLIFNECRYLVIDWNIKYGYGILEDTNLKDKTIIADGQYTTVQDVISPSDWKAILFTYFDSLATLGLITNAAFSKASLVVQIDPSNPNRFNTTFSYKRTGTSEIESTTVTVGF